MALGSPKLVFGIESHYLTLTQKIMQWSFGKAK
jgi:hypothetical protein